MSVILELPPDIGERLLADRGAAEPEVLRELALALYREGHLPPGRAAELAGLGRWEFERLLTERSVPLPYTAAMIAEDFADVGGRL